MRINTIIAIITASFGIKIPTLDLFLRHCLNLLAIINLNLLLIFKSLYLLLLLRLQ